MRAHSLEVGRPIDISTATDCRGREVQVIRIVRSVTDPEAAEALREELKPELLHDGPAVIEFGEETRVVSSIIGLFVVRAQRCRNAKVRCFVVNPSQKIVTGSLLGRVFQKCDSIADALACDYD